MTTLLLIYDGFPDLKTVFSASSALDLYRGEADLSRRVANYYLPGLSFREYLSFSNHGDFNALDHHEIFNDPHGQSTMVTEKLTILPLFRQYLKHGYFPFYLELKPEQYSIQLTQVINMIIDTDLSYIDGYSAAAAVKVKRLLGVVAESVPFKPNITALARKTEMSRDLIYTYLLHLQKAHLVQFLNQSGKGVSILQKPDKLYLENTNLAFALRKSPEQGNIRETFLLNQFYNAGLKVSTPKAGDFYLDDEEVTLEVGGRGEDASQIKGVRGSFLVIDDLETGYQNRIPLWLMGFLY